MLKRIVPNIHAAPSDVRFRADADEWWPAWPPMLTAEMRAKCDEDEARAREVACPVCSSLPWRACTRTAADAVVVDAETRAQGANCDEGTMKMHHALRLEVARMHPTERATYLAVLAKGGAR